MARNSNQRKQPAGQRQLRVGEEIRHALATVLMRGETHSPELDGVSITVSEVKISPDLKNATAYVMPLGGTKIEEVLDILNRAQPQLRSLVGQRIAMKFIPRLHFRVDTTYDEANRINLLLQQPEVLKDLNSGDDE